MFTKFQRQQPLSLRKGEFITLDKIISEKQDVISLRAELKELTHKDRRKIVLERYRRKPKDGVIRHVIGKGSFTLEQSIKEIEDDTDFGKELIEIEIQYIDRIFNGKIILEL